jgi:transcriptional regulator with XRE-family HTH domain
MMVRSQQVGTPTLAQRQLAARIRDARAGAGKTQEDAALALDCDVSKIYRLETARTPARVTDVKELAAIYGLDQRQTADLERLARGAKERGWTDDYLDIIPSTLSMLGALEAGATSILDYSVEVVHGLLQTEAYAKAFIRLATELDEDSQRSRLAFRMERQKRVLHRTDRPQLRFVLHETALLAQVGDVDLMAEQRAHLRELQQNGLVDIRVWTAGTGLHRWMGGAFTVLTFTDPADPHVVYIENQLEAHYYERAAQVQKIAQIFGEIRRRATPLEDYL